MDNIIQFPGGDDAKPKKPSSAPASGRISPEGSGQLGIPPLEDREKAIQSSPAASPAGGDQPHRHRRDFFTAIDGEADDLRNAGPHARGDRALYQRPGLEKKVFARRRRGAESSRLRGHASHSIFDPNGW